MLILNVRKYLSAQKCLWNRPKTPYFDTIDIYENCILQLCVQFIRSQNEQLKTVTGCDKSLPMCGSRVGVSRNDDRGRESNKVVRYVNRGVIVYLCQYITPVIGRWHRQQQNYCRQRVSPHMDCSSVNTRSTSLYVGQSGRATTGRRLQRVYDEPNNELASALL